MKLRKSIATASLTFLIASAGMSSYASADSHGFIGTILGGAGGAAIGSNIGKGKGNVAAIAVGTLIGASVGNTIGKSTRHHHRRHHRAHRSHYSTTSYTTVYPPVPVYRQVDYTLPYYQPQPLHIQSHSTTNVSAQSYCREFTQTITVGGKTQDSYGQACRQPDGQWQIQN